MKVSVFKSGSDRRKKSPWCVRWVDYSDGSRKLREKFFASERMAVKFGASLREVAKRSDVMLEVEEVAAVQLCRKSGGNLLEVVRAGLDVLRLEVDVVDRKVPTMEWAWECFKEDCVKRNLRPDTIRGYGNYIGAFLKCSAGNRKIEVQTGKNEKKYETVGRDRRLISSLEMPEEVLGFVTGRDGYNETSRRNARTALLRWIDWCAADPRGWCERVDRSKMKWDDVKQTKRRPMVLDADEAERLLKAVADKLKAAVAIALFAGVRPFELMRLEWCWLDDRGDVFGVDVKRRKIELAGDWTKGRTARTLHGLPDNLWVWLERFGAGEGLVIPVNQRNWYASIRRGFVDAGIAKRGNDVFRHSFGSHHRHRGLDATIDILGHTGDMKVFNEHYNNNAIGPEDAERYFSIVPE